MAKGQAGNGTDVKEHSRAVIGMLIVGLGAIARCVERTLVVACEASGAERCREAGLHLALLPSRNGFRISSRNNRIKSPFKISTLLTAIS